MLLSPPLPPDPPAILPLKFYEAKAREFAMMLTLGVDTAEELGSYYGLTASQTASLVESAYFRQLIAEAQEELKDSNTVLERAKAMARLAAPEAVTTLLSLSRNGSDMRVSRDSAETLLNLAGLATKSPAPLAAAGTQAGIAINISFSPAVPSNVAQRPAIDITPQV